MSIVEHRSSNYLREVQCQGERLPSPRIEDGDFFCWSSPCAAVLPHVCCMLAQGETGKACGIAHPLLVPSLLLPPTEQLHTNAQPRHATSCRGDDLHCKNSPEASVALCLRISKEHPPTGKNARGETKEHLAYVILPPFPK